MLSQRGTSFVGDEDQLRLAVSQLSSVSPDELTRMAQSI